MNIYIDIETIPEQNEGSMARIKETLSPPGNISKQESIDKWWKEKAPAAVEEKYLKTSFDGTYGEILCIGVAIDDNAPVVIAGSTEAETLKGFYDIMEKVNTPLFIGHNILKFDLPFIRHRSIINRVKPTVVIPDARFNNQDFYDTMQAWAGYGNFIGLDRLCAALGIESSKGDLDGSKVWEYVQAGRHQEVYDYCKRDVSVTREVYKRLTFQY